MSATHWASLKDYWNTACNTAVTNTTLAAPQGFEAHALLDRWIDAETAADSSAATDLSSYSIANRTVTRRNIAEQRKQGAAARAGFFLLLFGDATFSDFRVRSNNVEPTP